VAQLQLLLEEKYLWDKKMKNGQASTDTVIIFSILIFNGFLVLSLGFLNIDYEENNISDVLFSFGNIISNIIELGWGNILLFAPLIICLGYILAKLIRGGG
jgi:hypothetical protein